MKQHKSSLFQPFLTLMVIFLLSLVNISTVYAQDRATPEPNTGLSDLQYGKAKDFMVVTANPHATKAAYKILKDGGSAIDAAVAAQLVLGLTEPQSSGLGGGGFALYYDKQKNTFTSWDGRETAPLAAGPDLFLNEDGTPMSFRDSYMGGRAVGVPGTPKLLREMHYRYGKKHWSTLFDDAIDLAANGFEVSPRLAKIIEMDFHNLVKHEVAGKYFTDDFGKPLKAGHILKNPEYAKTLLGFKRFGDAFFYESFSEPNIIGDIVNTVQSAPKNPGLLIAKDIESYEVIEGNPICGKYRGYKICGMGEPSSGPLTILQSLAILQYFNVDHEEHLNTATIYRIIESMRLAFADRNAYIADPEFRDTPGEKLLAPEYIKRRARLIIPPNIIPYAPEGKLKDFPRNFERGTGPEEQGTTHISIVDIYGNILSMTSSIEQAFGSHLMVGGFFLNNELTDFSFTPTKHGYPVLNSVEGGKRPRSSMSPLIVFDKENMPFLVIGSAGGSRIIGYVLKKLVALIDWQTTLKEAMSMPHVLTRFQSPIIELEPELKHIAPSLEAMGYDVRVTPMNSGLTAIIFKNDRLYGAADPRREGTVLGD